MARHLVDAAISRKKSGKSIIRHTVQYTHNYSEMKKDLDIGISRSVTEHGAFRCDDQRNAEMNIAALSMWAQGGCIRTWSCGSEHLQV